METTYKSEQLRIDTIKSMPQSLAAKRLIRARLLRSINRRSHLSSTNSSALKNCKFFPVIFIKKVRRWYRQTFKYCDVWYNSMKDIEGRFGSKLAVYFKILRYLVMLNLFVTVFTFRWASVWDFLQIFTAEKTEKCAAHVIFFHHYLSLSVFQLHHFPTTHLRWLSGWNECWQWDSFQVWACRHTDWWCKFMFLCTIVFELRNAWNFYEYQFIDRPILSRRRNEHEFTCVFKFFGSSFSGLAFVFIAKLESRVNAQVWFHWWVNGLHAHTHGPQ